MMTLKERKQMMVGAIRELEARLMSLAYGEYDGAKSKMERDEEIGVLQRHLHCAHSVLFQIAEEELAA